MNLSKSNGKPHLRKSLESIVEELLDGSILLSEATEEFEKLYIMKALERNDKHISKTAEQIGIHRNTLSKRIADYKV